MEAAYPHRGDRFELRFCDNADPDHLVGAGHCRPADCPRPPPSIQAYGRLDQNGCACLRELGCWARHAALGGARIKRLRPSSQSSIRRHPGQSRTRHRSRPGHPACCRRGRSDRGEGADGRAATCLAVRRDADADGMPWPELRALRQHDRRLWMRRRKAVADGSRSPQVPSRMRSIFRISVSSPPLSPAYWPFASSGDCGAGAGFGDPLRRRFSSINLVTSASESIGVRPGRAGRMPASASRRCSVRSVTPNSLATSASVRQPRKSATPAIRPQRDIIRRFE
jgi:hypothetical protein